MVDPKVIAVTGANRGIGLAVAKHLSNQGYTLAACVRNSSNALEALVNPESNHKIFNLDLADDVSIQACFKEVRSWSNKVDGLVNCAGIAAGGLFPMTRMENMRNLFNVNLFGQLFLTQLFVKKMIRTKKGSIVNIASTAGILADPGTLSYGGSKAALMHATKVMAAELGAFGIRVNAIAPSVVETDMAKLMDHKSLALLSDRSSLPGRVEPQDIAELASFLISEKSRKITGQIIRLDGGMPF